MTPSPSRARIALALAVPSVAALLVSSIAVFARVRSERLADLDASLAERASALAHADLEHGNQALAADLVAWELRDATGAVVHAGAHRIDGVPDASTGPRGVTVADASGRRLRVWSGVVESNGANGADRANVHAVVAASLAPIERELRALAMTLAIVGALLAACAVALAAWMSARLLEPLRKLSETAASQARFAADASHELRTPLAVVKTEAEVTLRRERTPEEYKAALATVGKAADRMHDLVESLLVLARTDATSDGARDAPLAGRVDVAAVARRIVEERRERADPAIAGSSVAWVVEADGPAWVVGDEPQLAMVVRNLVANAVRYTRAGSITVRVRAENGQATLSVEDTGDGIPPDALPHVFERFYRADVARSRDTGGAGLGLSIVKAIVDRHRGTIRADSAVGRGSTFTVKIPLSSGGPQVGAVG